MRRAQRNILLGLVSALFVGTGVYLSKHRIKHDGFLKEAEIQQIRQELEVALSDGHDKLGTREQEGEEADRECYLLSLTDEGLSITAHIGLLDIFLAEPELLARKNGERYLRFLFRRYDEIEAVLLKMEVPDTICNRHETAFTPSVAAEIEQRDHVENEQFCVHMQILLLSRLLGFPMRKVEDIELIMYSYHIDETLRLATHLESWAARYSSLRNWMLDSSILSCPC